MQHLADVLIQSDLQIVLCLSRESIFASYKAIHIQTVYGNLSPENSSFWKKCFYDAIKSNPFICLFSVQYIILVHNEALRIVWAWTAFWIRHSQSEQSSFTYTSLKGAVTKTACLTGVKCSCKNELWLLLVYKTTHVISEHQGKK